MTVFLGAKNSFCGRKTANYKLENLSCATFLTSALSGDLFTVLKSLAQRPKQTETRKLRRLRFRAASGFAGLRRFAGGLGRFWGGKVQFTDASGCQGQE